MGVVYLVAVNQRRDHVGGHGRRLVKKQAQFQPKLLGGDRDKRVDALRQGARQARAPVHHAERRANERERAHFLWKLALIQTRNRTAH